MESRKFIATTMREYLNEQQNIENSLNGNFVKWFGNSKIADKSGKPLVVYHGSKVDFKNFDDRKKGNNTDSGLRGRGFYFSNNIKSSQGYGSILKKVYLRIENPFDLLSFNSLNEIINFLGIDSTIIHERGRGTPHHSVSVYSPFSGIFSDNIREKGFDGILHGQEFVVFEPNQIKSTENDGSWSINGDNIYS
jgi:hypothetical protein